jgi:hypothetical protein
MILVAYKIDAHPRMAAHGCAVCGLRDVAVAMRAFGTVTH